MSSNSEIKINYECLAAIILLIAVFIIIPYKIISKGYRPTDDANRHVAFSLTEQKWSDVLEIAPGLEADHNVGWHRLLRFVYRIFRIDKKGLLLFSVIGLFMLFNITGSLVSPNKAAWLIVLIVMFLFDRSIIFRTLLGRPFILSGIVTLLLLRLWFVDSSKLNSFVKFMVSIIALSLAVYIHGTWYTFLMLPMALLLAGQVKKAFGLTFCIIVSTFVGAYLTGDFQQFLYFHFVAPLNIFSERLYNWQLVTEFAEGNIHLFWIIPTAFILFLSIYTKKLKLNDLSKDAVFILILLTWLLSIKVIRFWSDWGIVALMFWLSFNLSELIGDMQTVKKPILRRILFVVVAVSAIILIPSFSWGNKKEVASYCVDFSNKEFADFRPLEGGIIYNDSMRHFYFQFFAEPEAKYKYILGFEPAIMPIDDKKIFRDISYNQFHFKAYKPWVDKLTPKDRLFTSVDIRDCYPQLDWIKAGSKLYIGKIKNEE